MGSRALPAFMYGNPELVAERKQLRSLGCRACVSHRVVLGRVVCGDVRNETQQKGVPHVGSKCRFFNLKS